MRRSTSVGIGLLLVGLLLGGVLAGGMYAAEQAARARLTPVPGPLAAPARVSLKAEPGDETRGRVVYDRTCASCHGAGGKGSQPLRGPLINTYYRDQASLAGLLRNGIGTMAGYTDSELPDQAVADVIAYIRSLP